LNLFIEGTVARDEIAWAKQLRGVIAKMGGAPAIESSSKEPPEPKVPKNIFSPKLELDDVDEEEIARQMCILDFELYARVKPAGLLLKSWERHKARSPNIVALIARFNKVVKWVAGSVLGSGKLVGKRPKVVPRFLRIAEHLRALNNFFSLGAIYTGLTCSKVHHQFRNLTQSLSSQQQSVLSDLEKLFSYESNYKNYRAAYGAAKPPCIPLISVHLRDIAFIEDCSPQKISGLINFEKRQRLRKFIDAFLSYQPIPYHYHKVYQIMVFLQEPKVDDVNLSGTLTRNAASNM